MSIATVMSPSSPSSRGSEQGFTLIELLVVILIIGILAAIAIPSFLSQKGKASDASGKEVARTGETVEETYATDHAGTYTASLEELHKYEPALQTTAANNNAYLSAVEIKNEESGTGNGYKVTSTSSDGHTFSITKKANGTVERTCTPTGVTGSAGGGCQNGTW